MLPQCLYTRQWHFFLGALIMLEECRGKWRVVASPLVEKVFRKRGLLEAFRKWLEELKKELNNDPEAIQRLLREPIVARHGGPVRRYRLWLGKVWWRLLFAVDVSRCEVVFIAADRRDEETYRRLWRHLR